MNRTKVKWAVRAGWYRMFHHNIDMPSYIGKPTFVSNIKNIHFGSKVRIYPGLRAEIVNEKSSVTIGNNVSIGQNFHVVSYDENLVIGDDVVIAGNVLITNCDHDYKGPHDSVLENELVAKHTEIGNGCFIGNNACILAGTVLGSNCVVGANAVVRGHFEDNSIIVGAPAKTIKIYKREENE